MNMKLKMYDLECFSKLCKYKNFTKAAEKMFISQPAFSRIIQKLEATIGCPLVNRCQSNFALTSIGERVLEEVHDVLESYHCSLKRLDNLLHKRPSVRLGFTPIVSQLPGFYNLVNILPRDCFDLSLDEFNSKDLHENLEKSEVDIGIFHFPLPDKKALKHFKINVFNGLALLPESICCLKKNRSYQIVLKEDEVDKPYNDYIMSKLLDYDFQPYYIKSTQFAPQIALMENSVFIQPEHLANVISSNSSLRVENFETTHEMFGIYAVIHKMNSNQSSSQILKKIISLKIVEEKGQSCLPKYINDLIRYGC